jgi:hypothetical protein
MPLNLRVTPRTREGLERLAEDNGRSLSQESEFMLELGLLSSAGAQASGEPIVAGPIFLRGAGASTNGNELIGRFIQLEADLAGLRAAVEKGLDRNAEVIGRIEARLFRRVAEFEAKVTTDATEVTTAVMHLQTVTAHLLSALNKLDAELTERRREAAGNTETPKNTPPTGDELISVDEVATLVHISRRTVLRRMAEAGIHGIGRGRAMALTYENYDRLIESARDRNARFEARNRLGAPLRKARKPPRAA